MGLFATRPASWMTLVCHRSLAGIKGYEGRMRNFSLECGLHTSTLRWISYPQGSGSWLLFGSNIARAEVRINTLFWPSSAASLVEEIATWRDRDFSRRDLTALVFWIILSTSTAFFSCTRPPPPPCKFFFFARACLITEQARRPYACAEMHSKHLSLQGRSVFSKWKFSRVFN